MPPPQGETYVPTKPKAPPAGAPGGPKAPPAGAPGGPKPPPPQGAASGSGGQFGTTETPKPPPPMRVKGTERTVTRPLSEAASSTWSGYYGDLLSGSTDVQTDFNKILPERASRLSVFTNQDGYHIPEGHPSSA
eukprot:1522587-Amphidinium_carterae.1